MLSFVRSDLAELTAYTPHPEGVGGETAPDLMDQLDTNECPYDLPGPLKQKIASHYEEIIATNRYPDGGHDALKALIAEYVASALPDETVLTANWVSIGNGSDELIRSILIATCLGNNGGVLVANPTFSMYGILAQTLGIPVVTIARDEEFAFSIAEAQAAVAHPDRPIRVVFVVHPNSPTGNVLTPPEIDWLKSLPPEILVVVDEAYFEFSQQTLVAEVLTRPNWLITRTFSKAFRLAAHRVGYAIANPALIQILEKVRLPYNIPALSLAAAQVALENHQDLLDTLPEVQQERARLATAISALPGLTRWPSQANFIYVQGSTPAATAALAQTLKQQGTCVRHTGGGLRITIGSPAENSRTIAHLQTAAQATP